MKRIMLFTIAFLGAALAAQADTAKENWQANCAVCHGKEGEGNTGMGRYLGVADFQSPKVQASFTDEQAVKAIKEGIVKDGKTKMKSFGAKLSDQEIKELVKYVRAFKKGK
jgi:mono/diheme cytochrome c family protein